MSKYHIIVESTLNASIDVVWKVMTDIQDYPKWNRFITKVEANNAEPVPGTIMKFKVEFKPGSKAVSTEIVKSLEKPQVKEGKKTAEWIYDYYGFLPSIGMVKATRIQKLVELEDGKTHYYTCEKFSGWGKLFLPLKNVQTGFNTHAADLKKECERIAAL